jgi:hypothetical protein
MLYRTDSYNFFPSSDQMHSYTSSLFIPYFSTWAPHTRLAPP